MVVRSGEHRQMNTAGDGQRSTLVNLQSRTGQERNIVLQLIGTIFQHHIIVIGHREWPVAQCQFFARHFQFQCTLSGAAVDGQRQLSHIAVERACLAAIVFGEQGRA